MTVEFRTGDLFDQADIHALGHGVNTHGVMGSGIAPLFKRRWPPMYDGYRRHCLDGNLHVGNVWVWTAHDGTTIYNMATQGRPGRNADLDAVRTCLTKALTHAEQHHIDAIAIPRIGAGIGGLRWEDVEQVIHDVADASPVRLVVVTLPGQV